MRAWRMIILRLSSASVPLADSMGSIVVNTFHKGKPIESFVREIHLMNHLVGCEGFGNLAQQLLHRA